MMRIPMRLLASFAAAACAAAAAASTPATPVRLWKSLRLDGDAANWDAADTTRARVLTDGSTLVVDAGRAGLAMTRVDASGNLLSSVLVPTSWTESNPERNVFAATVEGEVYAAGDGWLRKYDARTGIPLWWAAEDVGIASTTRIAVDPSGDLLVAGRPRSSYGGSADGIVIAKLDRFTGRLAMGPFLLSQLYGNFVDLAVDPAGNPVVVGSVYGATPPAVAGKFSGASGLEIWGPSPVPVTSTEDLQARCGPSGDLFVLGGGTQGMLARLSGTTGAVLWGPLQVGWLLSASLVFDADGDVFLAGIPNGGDAKILRVSPGGSVAWTSPSFGATFPDRVQVDVDGAGDVLVAASRWGGIAMTAATAKLRHDTGAFAWGPVVTQDSLVTKAGAAAVQPNGDLVVAGPTRTNGVGIARFSGSGGSAAWGPVVSPRMDSPGSSWSGALVNAAGDALLVGRWSADSWYGDIAVSKQSGATGETLWGPTLLEADIAWNAPLLATLDPVGNVVVATAGSSTAIVYAVAASDGRRLWGPTALTGMDALAGIQADAAGDVFVLRRAATAGGPYTFSLSKLSATTGLHRWGPITWQSTAAVNDSPTALALDAAGNPVVAGTSRVSQNGGTIGVVLSFSGASGALLWGPLTLDDGGQSVTQVFLSPAGGGACWATTVSSTYSAVTAIVVRKIDAAGTVVLGPVSPTLTGATGTGYYLWGQRAGVGGDLFLTWGGRLAKIRASDAGVAWEAEVLSSGGGLLIDVDPEGNVAASTSGAATLSRLSGADGTAMWSPLPASSAGSIASFGALACRGRDVIVAGVEKNAAASARITADLAIDAPSDGLLAAACGRPYAAVLTPVNGRDPYVFDVVAGALPPGLQLSSGGSIAGTPYGAGAYASRVRVTDADARSAERDLFVVLLDGEPLLPVLVSPGAACAGSPVTLSVAGAWSSYEWLPGGETSPTISPSVTHPTPFGVRVTDSAGCERHGAIVLAPALPTVGSPAITAPANAPAWAAGFVASVPAHAGSAYQWALSSGTITAGQGTNSMTFSTGAAGPLTITVLETPAGGCGRPGSHIVTVSSASSSGFYPIPPCRVLDTRASGPALAAGAKRVVAVSGACGIPAGATAVAANVTSVVPQATGDLRFGPGNLPTPSLGTLPLVAGRVRAVSAVLGLATDGTGTVAFSNASAAPVDVLLDVSGYFR